MVTGGVRNLSKVVQSLQAQTLKGRKKMEVQVGYSAPYAIYVHENLQAQHPNGGQAKYLEQPTHLLQHDMASLVVKRLKQKKGLEDALQEAGELLLTASKLLVPVQTGALRDSGFVQVVSI